jgi:hypothetical protein
MQQLLARNEGIGEALRGQGRPGRVNYLDVPNQWPALWDDIQARERVSARFSKIMIEWDDLGLNCDSLNEAMADVGYAEMMEFLKGHGPLRCFERYKPYYCKSVTEDDKVMLYDHSYCISFVYCLQKYGLHTESQFCKEWMALNGPSMERNLDASIPYSAVNLLVSCMPQFSADPRSALLKSAYYRAGKSYAGMMRELHLLLGVASDIQDDLYGDLGDVTVFSHPFLDIGLHCDGVLVADSEVTRLCTYLDTPTSAENNARKSAGAALDGLRTVNAKVGASSIGNEITVMHPDNIAVIKASANGVSSAMAYTRGLYK